MINIDGKIFANIQIDGNDIPSSANLLNQIVLTEGNGALSPAVQLVLNDTSGHLTSDLALTEGNEILVTVGKNIDDIKTVSRQYRLFGMRQQVTAFGPQILAVGIYDAPGFLSGSYRESYSGTSSDVIKQIAQKCKLCYSGPEDFNGKHAADSQVWLNVCKNRAMFIQETTRHGYIDEHSGMASALTSLGQLRYRNLLDVIETPPEQIKRLFLHNVPAEQLQDSSKVIYPVRQAKDRSHAGLMNNWQNYGSTRVSHDLSGKPKIDQQLGVKTNASFLAINDQVAQTIGKSRIDYSPLHCGNTHDTYFRALYQNVKHLGLFSERLSLLVTEVTDVQLFDPVIYRQANADLTQPVKNSDIYLVVGKTIFVKGGTSYAERIELARMSLTTKGETELKCQDPGSDSYAAIPNSSIDPVSMGVPSNSLPGIRNLASQVSPVEQIFNNIKAALPQQNNAIGIALSAIHGITTAINGGGSPASILVALNSAIPALRGYTQSSRILNTLISSASPLMSGLNQLLLGNNSISPSVRQATLFNPGGIMESYSATLGGMKQQSDMVNLLNPIQTSLSGMTNDLVSSNGQQTLDDWNSLTSDANDGFSQVSSNVGSMWNSSLSTLNGIPVPTTIPNNGNDLILSNLANSSYGNTSFGYTNVSSSSSLQKFTDLVKTEILKITDQKLPRWVPKGPITKSLTNNPVSNSDSLIQSMTLDTQVAARRNNEMFSSTWG